MNWFLDTFRGRHVRALWLALAAAVIVSYLPTFQNGFVNLDDPVYVITNVKVHERETNDTKMEEKNAQHQKAAN